MSDVLNQTRSQGRIRYGATDLQFLSRWESRQARFSFTYNCDNRSLKAAR